MKMISTAQYTELLDNCVNYNKRLSQERRERMPFLDNHTRIFQVPSNLWRSRRERCPGPNSSVVYTYPVRKLRKRPGSVALAVPITIPYRTETSEGESFGKEFEAPSRAVAVGGAEEGFYAGMDELSDQDFDDFSDGDDYEELYMKRKRGSTKRPAKPATTAAAKRQSQGVILDPTVEYKPYVCDFCGVRYKTKPGLNYHLNHSHGVAPGSIPPPQPQPPPPALLQPPPIAEQIPLVRNSGNISDETAPSGLPPDLPTGSYCDYCWGTSADCKKTNRPEDLVKCSDCGRAGHPSCLNFTPNMIISTKKYGWQCIECKSCYVCGTSENDDQLLFCDDCDMGYHLYCLQPPLSIPPEGNWSCSRCRIEFGSQSASQSQISMIISA